MIEKKKKKKYRKPEIREEKLILTVEAQITHIPLFNRLNKNNMASLWANYNSRLFPKN